jgi:aerobic carbon-monoxide dehydrogenase medium subunit
VKPAPFAYHRPRGLEEALDVLAALGSDGKVLAGGQSLVPLMSMRLAAPPALVDVNHVPGLATVEVGEQVVRIGALARHSQVEHDAAAYDAVPLLRQALQQVAHPTIRNRGTTVGSLVHGDPAAEMSAVLLLLDGSVTLRDVTGSREVPAADFFTGPMETALRPGELAVAATFRRPAAGSGTSFVEVARRHGDYAVCGVGAVVHSRAAADGADGAEGAPSSARVALVSVGPGPVLVDLAPALAGGTLDDERVHALVEEAIDPEEDIHASADYRRHLAHVLVRRALLDAQHRAARRAA